MNECAKQDQTKVGFNYARKMHNLMLAFLLQIENLAPEIGALLENS